MQGNPNAEVLKGAAQALRRAAKKHGDLVRELKEGTFGIQTDIVMDAASIALKTPDFMLETFSGDRSPLEEAAKKLDEAAAEREKLDNLEEVLSGEEDRGLVYVPTDVLRDLKRLADGDPGAAGRLQRRCAEWLGGDRSPGPADRLMPVRPEGSEGGSPKPPF